MREREIRLRRRLRGESGSVRERLAALASRGDAAVERRDAETVLRERARDLARDTARDEAPRASLRVARFALAGERYAIEARFVHGIVGTIEAAPVPSGPPHLFGLAYLRGEILPIFDIRGFLRSGPRGLDNLSRLLLLGRETIELAVLADEVQDVDDLDERDLLEPPQPLSEGASDLVRAVTAAGVVLLDAVALLEDPRLRVDDTE